MARILIPFPTVIPAANGKGVLFTTHPKAPGDLTVYQAANAALGIVGPSCPELNIGELNFLEFTWTRNDQASAPNGVRVFLLTEKKTTWYETNVPDDANASSMGAIQVPIIAGGAGTVRTWKLDCSGYLVGVAVELTEGAVLATARDGVFVAHTTVETVSR